MARSDIFPDRADAGRQLAAKLGDFAGRSGVLVLGLARGGVPVAFEVARALEAPSAATVGGAIGHRPSIAL
jgi:predicted phosphoribosyltransferase